MLWGKSGHIQTLIYAKLGRVKPKFPEGERHHYVMPDGATMSFDVYDPHSEGKEGRGMFRLLHFNPDEGICDAETCRSSQ